MGPIEDYAQDYAIDMAKWREPKPHGISGMFRFKHEGEFGVHAISSHAKWLDEVVVILNLSDNETRFKVETVKNTLNRLAAYQDNFPTVRVLEYPFEIPPSKSMKHAQTPDNSIHAKAYFNNWCASNCQYSWIAKIEGDVIALSSFGKIRKRVDENPDQFMYHGRYGLNLAGLDGTMFASHFPRNAGWDEGVFNNDPDKFMYTQSPKWAVIKDFPLKPRSNVGFSFMHLKRCKKENQTLPERKYWEPFTKENVCKSLEAYKREHGGYQGEDGICPDILFEDIGVFDA